MGAYKHSKLKEVKINKDGTIETVADMIECLKKCNQEAKIVVRPSDKASVNIVEEPDGVVYLDISLII